MYASLRKSHYLTVITTLLLVFFSPVVALAQDAEPDCEGMEIISGLGTDTGALSADSHRVTIRITDADAVRDTIGRNMIAYVFYGTGQGERYFTYSENLIPTSILSNQVTTTFEFDNPLGSLTDASGSDWAYVYLYNSTSRLASAKCMLGFYQRVVSGDTPAPPPPATEEPPIDQIPQEPPFPEVPDEIINTRRYSCGEVWEQRDGVTDVCECTDAAARRDAIATRIDTQMCCGWNINGRCSATFTDTTTTPPPAGGGGNVTSPPAGGGGGTTEDPTDASNPEFNVFGPDADTFRRLNPLRDSPVGDQLASPGGIVSRILVFAFPLAGLILFAMIVWGGFEMLTSATSSKGVDAGRQRVTNAIIGFIILFSSYWIIQIVQVVFGVAIL